MFRRRFFPTALAFLLVTTVLLAGGFALSRAGWSQGYTAGLQAGGDGEAIPDARAWCYGLPSPVGFGTDPLMSSSNQSFVIWYRICVSPS